MNRVLIVEDDTLLNTTLAYHLRAGNGNAGSAAARREGQFR